MRSHGLLAGFTPAVWLVTALTAVGGLLVASVVKHTNTVLKTYASATAILVTCTITAVATRVPPSPGFVLGLLIVLASMGLYNGVGWRDLASLIDWPWVPSRARAGDGDESLAEAPPPEAPVQAE